MSVRPVMMKILATPDSSPNITAAAQRWYFEWFHLLPYFESPRKIQNRLRGLLVRMQLSHCWAVLLFRFPQEPKNQLLQLHAVPDRKIRDYLGFASHVSKSPDMIIKTAALNVIPLTPGLISKTTCAAFLNQFHPFLVRTFGMSLNHSCPTPLLCTMSILDKQHFTLNQTCPMS